MVGIFVFIKIMPHTIYILYSKKLNRFYTGETSDLDQRLVFHKNSPTHKFTGKADDWELFYEFECPSKKIAKLIEAHIKRMKSRRYIENLKRYPEIMERLMEKYG